MTLVVGESRSPIGQLRHLAMALFWNEDLRETLQGTIPQQQDELWLALTDVSRSSVDREVDPDPRPPGRMTVQPGSGTSSQIEGAVRTVVERVLKDPSVQGVEAKLRLFQEVLSDQDVRLRLSTVLDLKALEEAIAASLADAQQA